MKKIACVLSTIFIVCAIHFYMPRIAVGMIRVVAYNTANNPDNITEDAWFNTIFDAIGKELINGKAKQLDILVALETDTGSSARLVDILNNLYDVNSYAVKTSTPDSGSDRTAVVYNTSTVELLDSSDLTNIGTHNILRSHFRLANISDYNSEFYVYAVHLKSGNSTSDKNQRIIEAQNLRNNADALGQGSLIIFAGDFNMYGSSEGAWINLLASGNAKAFDVANSPGEWHDNASFKSLHTQNSRDAMDDRFDFQFVTGEFLDGTGLDYIPKSFHVFGNNGTHNFDEAISTGTGASVSVLEFLENASDHLPVVADYDISKSRSLSFLLPLLLNDEPLNDEPQVILGWNGNLIVPNTDFYDVSKWTLNQLDYAQGDRITVTSDGSNLQLNWTLGTGVRDKWVQCYKVLTQPVSLSNVDIFGFDLKGSAITGNVEFELKFEEGSNTASVIWKGIPGITRWIKKLVVPKKQFDRYNTIDWSKIDKISFAVRSSEENSGSISGTLNIKNLVASLSTGWIKAKSKEIINPANFTNVKINAINALINRQQASTGLLTTWEEEGLSYLYGQGLTLKALTLEGVWNGTTPVNKSAQAAEKLALFLINHQIDHQRGAYWPRTWQSSTGNIVNNVESDGTIWMGDLPWPLIGLQCYYKKTGDARLQPAIEKALSFIKSLIHEDGKIYTLNVNTNQEKEVTSCEAYAAVLLSLYESNENQLAENTWNYILNMGWDSDLRYWKEAKDSYRIVLFANTWLSPFLMKKGLNRMALDSLTFVGKTLYTNGPGEPWGLDGLGPIAVWYEGTLSYICAGGPHSIELFNDLKNYINEDGTVSHYNDTLGSTDGHWAVDWHSLDGTSWLYFAASGTSPFSIINGNPYQP